jgi:putative Holliday junction resolvase
MSRILGLDIGDKFIGVALSDPSGKIAQGLETFQRQGLEKDLAYLNSLVKKYEVTRLVIGLPKRLNGSLGIQGEKTLILVNLIKENINCPVLTWDERLTTRWAERSLLEADLSRKKRKKVINQVAAQLLLQGYLDSQKNST